MESVSAVLKANSIIEVEGRIISPPASGEYQIRVRAAGICSSDIARTHYNGAYFYPLVPGHEIAGEIAAVGRHCTSGLAIGTPVVIYPLIACKKCESCVRRDFHLCTQYGYYGSRCDGGFQQFFNVNEENILEVPGGVSFELAALTEPLAVVLHAIRKAKAAGLGNRILVSGAGTLGQMAVEVIRFRESSAQVTLVDRNAEKLNLQTHQGIQRVHLDGTAAWTNFSAQCLRAFDTFFDFTGDFGLLAYAAQVLDAHGRVILVGNPLGSATLDKQTMDQVLRKELRIIGSWNSLQHEDWNEALQLLARGLDLRHLISQTISLIELPGVLHSMAQRRKNSERSSVIKVIVRP